MTSKRKFNIDLINIDEILINNAIIENNTRLTRIASHNYFDIGFSFTNQINIVQKKVRTIFSCEIKTYTSSDELIDISGKFDIALEFQIDNLEELVLDEEKGIKVDSDLILSLANICYSTSRGIIYTRCQGTILQKTILPILSNQKLIEILQEQVA